MEGPSDSRLQVAVAFSAALLALSLSRMFERYRKSRQPVSAQLSEARAKVEKLQQKLALEEEKAKVANRVAGKKKVVIWVDGAFDMMHFGHMNAFRQARALGTHLVVGINDSKSITECKGSPPIMNDEERTGAVRACKFVDHIEPNCPYIMTDEYLHKMIKKWKIDYVVHGDDPCIVDGRDVYESAQKLGKYRTIPRTEGVSTTDIVGRMLLLTKSHHLSSTDASSSGTLQRRTSGLVEFKDRSTVTRHSSFLTTNRILRLFSAGFKQPAPGARIVYVDGSWDMFHVGHMALLKEARKLGDYLVVGIHNDELVNLKRGSNFPIMNLHERTLSVLGCRWVDDVLLDAPWEITKEMVASLNISLVVKGTCDDQRGLSKKDDHQKQCYSVPIEMGLFKQINSSSTLTVTAIGARLEASRERYVDKYQKKSKVEQEYYNQRYGFANDGGATDPGDTNEQASGGTA